jgi:hypothetical protein
MYIGSAKNPLHFVVYPVNIELENKIVAAKRALVTPSRPMQDDLGIPHNSVHCAMSPIINGFPD